MSLLTEVFKLYFSSSSLITKLVVIPINRKTAMLIKELLNRKSRAQKLITGKLGDIRAFYLSPSTGPFSTGLPSRGKTRIILHRNVKRICMLISDFYCMWKIITGRNYKLRFFKIASHSPLNIHTGVSIL